MKSSALRRAKSSSKGITTSSSTPRPSITSRLTLKGMISFGNAAGCSTSSGWGSKVSTVSASSITAWWPRWTPSKVPIATWRGRGSASGSEVTLIWAIRPPLSQRLGRGGNEGADLGEVELRRRRPRPANGPIAVRRSSSQ